MGVEELIGALSPTQLKRNWNGAHDVFGDHSVERLKGEYALLHVRDLHSDKGGERTSSDHFLILHPGL